MMTRRPKDARSAEGLPLGPRPLYAQTRDAFVKRLVDGVWAPMSPEEYKRASPMRQFLERGSS